MGHALYIDPIAHAWRHCNPNAPLPYALVPRGALSGLALSLYRSNGQLVAEWSATKKDTQHGPIALATLPRISSPMGE